MQTWSFEEYPEHEELESHKSLQELEPDSHINKSIQVFTLPKIKSQLQRNVAVECGYFEE